ncbi:MAG: hypothetical protein Q7S51_11015 [Gallionellaceae bacterium]|nr:hypothetical protein [Gallionellaceae bacterium]
MLTTKCILKPLLQFALVCTYLSMGGIQIAQAGGTPSPGSLDTTFGINGITQTDFNNLQNEVTRATTQADGKIVVIGYDNNLSNTAYDFVVVRYHPNGSLDTSFGTNGRVTTDFYDPSMSLSPWNTDVNDYAESVAIQPDGKIIVAGTTAYQAAATGYTYGTSDFALARYNSNGTLDSTFGNGGKLRIDFAELGQSDGAADLLILPNGQILVVGTAVNGYDSSSQTSYTSIAMIRLDSDGGIDRSFGNRGKTLSTSNEWQIANAVLQPDGKIVVGGHYGISWNYGRTQAAVARFNADGSADSSFGTNGYTITAYPSTFESYFAEVAVQVLSDGTFKIVGVGSAWAYLPNTGGFSDGYVFTAARYNSDGTLDATFDGDGLVVTNLPRVYQEYFNSLIVQADGKILAGGASTGVITLIRYNVDGSLDTRFGSKGIASSSAVTGWFNKLLSVANNKVVAVGTMQGGSTTYTDHLLTRYFQ